MKMFRWGGKVALVTGASSGIGRATAIALAEQGLKVVGMARRKDKLEEVEDKLKDVKGEFHPVPGDVSKESDILRVFDYIRRELNGVDVLINNAGVVYSELLINGRTENYRKILDINVLGATICLREAIKSIQERSTEGHIVNINSIVGRYPTIGKAPFSIYQASKYALSAISEVARDELTHVKARVKVTNICPGLVHTDMAKNMTRNETFFKKAPYIEAKDVVDAIIYTLGTPPNVQVTELVIVPQHFPPVKLMV